MLNAVYDFVVKYAPNVIQDNVFKGYQNRISSPKCNNFIVISLEDTLRIGTNISDYSSSQNNQYGANVLRDFIIAIDFCSTKQEVAQEQAEIIETLCNSYIAVNFFNEYNLCFNYSDDVEYIPYVDLQQQYLHRYRVLLHINKWKNAVVSQQFADKVEITQMIQNARIENIDTHHKP